MFWEQGGRKGTGGLCQCDFHMASHDSIAFHPHFLLGHYGPESLASLVHGEGLVVRVYKVRRAVCGLPLLWAQVTCW